MAKVVQNEVTYHGADQCDYQRISDLCASEGWNTSPEEAKYLSSFLPNAAQVARSGDTTIGRFQYEVESEKVTVVFANS